MKLYNDVILCYTVNKAGGLGLKKSTVALRLDHDTQQRLKALGRARDRSPHYLMKQAVEKFLAREEELEREKLLTQSRWERFELTGETIAHSEVKEWIASLSLQNTSDADSDAT